MHHAALVLAALWAAATTGWTHPALFLVAIVYIFAVNERYMMRLRKRLQYEERKSANQRRLLSDAETVRWLNYAVEKIWPVCLERIASQQFLLPIFPWFINKFKPWTARKAEIQNLYLGRNPPMFTDIRAVSQSTDDDHLVLEIGMNFLAADDMDATMAVQLRKRLGFGITANMHITGMHVEGRVLVGVRFLRQWPFIGRVRVCFVEPPYFQMTVKPLFGHGLDVTELPGISGWLDRMLDVAFGQTLVEPNMLVIDMEKFASESKSTDNWFTVDEKPPIAHAKVEILEGADMKPSDPNGLSDPYVKGHLGPYRFQTKIHKKTLNPKWLEQFKIPITSWESLNLLSLQVRDKDHIFDDALGDCSISINKLRGGQRHDIWMALKHIKTGRIHVAITVLEDEDEKVCNHKDEQCGTLEEGKASTPRSSFSSRTNTESASSAEYRKMSDEYEPVDIEGLDKAGVWVHRPGSDVSATWEPRRGRARCQDSQILRENDVSDSPRSSVSESQTSSSSTEEPASGKSHRHLRKVKKGLVKLAGVMRHKSSNNGSDDESSPCVTPHPNIRPVGENRVSVKYVVDEDVGDKKMKQRADDQHSSPERGEVESPTKRQLRKKAAHMVKHAGKTAHNLKSMFSRKGLDKGKEDECRNDEEDDLDEMKVDSPVPRSDVVEAQEAVADGKDKAL